MSRKDDYKTTAKKNKNAKNYASDTEVVAEKKDKKTKAYKNPASTLAGKIIIVILALLMAFGGLFTLIYYIATKR